MHRILVVLAMSAQERAELESQAPDADFIYKELDQVTEEDVQEATVILGNVRRRHLQGSKKLRWLQLDSAGSDQYAILPLFQEGRALLSNATGSYGVLIAEYMVGASVLLNAGFLTYRDQQAQRLWASGAEARTIEGSRTLVVGLGDIGSEFARRMHFMGSVVKGIRRTEGEKPPYVASVHTLADLPALLPEADIVGVCLPNSPLTQQVFNRETFALMKPGASFINVGRGSAVDTDALLEALKEGPLGGAVVDVFDPEPLPADHPLWACKNLLITPHVGGLNEQSGAKTKINRLTIENLGRFMRGETLKSQVDPATGYRMK